MLTGCGAGDPTASSQANSEAAPTDASLTILAAASLTEAFDSILANYDSQASFVTSYGASSTLALQVQSRAPADLIATADAASMAIALEGRNAGTPEIFAYNELVIAVQPGNPLKISSLSDLGGTDILVSMCAPAVPCGKLADAALTAGAVSLPKASRAPDVKAALAPLIAGEVDVALVYRTDVMAADLALVELPDGQAQATEYLVAALDGPNQEEAQAFVTHLRSPSAKTLLTDCGFTVP